MVQKTALIALVLVSNCLSGFAIPSTKVDGNDRFCIDEFQWGCTKSSDCCNEEHKCYILDGPSDINGLLGRCQLPEEKRVEAKTCVADNQHGCHSVTGSDCCSKDFLCINSVCQKVPTILAEEEKFCVDEFQWGCTENSDCCDETHECNTFGPPSDMNGLLGRCEPKAQEAESAICIEDHQLGCHSLSGSECCNKDRLCINSRCKPVPTILAEEEKFCVDEFQWGCKENSDCCDETHECNTFGPPSDMNGLLGRCEPKAKKVESETCIDDHQYGCHDIYGSECCNEDRLCINSHCRPVPTILTEDEKFCVDEFQWGCKENSDCCDETHECNTFGPPSDMNGLLGRCEPKAEKVESNTCIEDHQYGCHDIYGSECCNEDRLCINSHCRPVPTILTEEEKFCVDEFQWGCVQNSDCCDETHECNTFGPPSDMNGLLGRCEPKAEKVESNTCIEDHQYGCHDIYGSECCNEDRLCINSHCRPVPTILAEEEKFCVDEYQWGCSRDNDCCNAEHKCYTFGPPSDMNGLMGRCQPPEDAESKVGCVSHWGCKKSSDCCNQEHKCYVSNGPSDLNGLGGRCDF